MGNSISAKDLLKTEGILTCSPSCTLAQALAKLNSSHDAVFVVDEKEKLLGVISPYYALFQGNFPPTTKAKNCVYSPPKIKESTTLWEIARNMVESKVYYLPVFSQNEQWIGIVSYRSVFGALLANPVLLKTIQVPRISLLVTINENASLSEARELLRKKGVSRLPVVTKTGRLAGILTRFDLRGALAEPKSSQSFLSRQGEKKKFADKPIRGLFKKNVITVSEKTPIPKMVRTMLENEIGSLILVNAKWQPTRIVTNRDLLKAIADKRQPSQATLDVTMPVDFAYEKEITVLLQKFVKKLLKKEKVRKIRVILKSIKNPAGKDKSFRTTILSENQKNKIKLGEATEPRWKTSVRKAMAKIEKQM